MDVVLLSRLQFAVAVFFHFVFVPVTLGLSVLIAVMETRYVRTGDPLYKRMAKFWGKLFLINFALGVVTGITLEFQFGTNWSRYSEFVGDIFGPLLAVEATVAFFLESTFVAVWHFGWDKVSKRVHLFAIWAVAVAGNLSALWIILANGWMQRPTGFAVEGGKAVPFEFWRAFANEFAWSQFVHTILACWALAGFFVLGVSAWHLARKSHVEVFSASFRLAAGFTLVTAVAVALHGHSHGMLVARHQPAKLAAMESHWETGSSVPMYLIAFPDEKNERNLVQALPVPGLLSFLAYGDFSAQVRGLKDLRQSDYQDYLRFREQSGLAAREAKAAGEALATGRPAPERPVFEEKDARPPVLLTFASFRLMVGLGGLFILLAALSFIWRKDVGRRAWFAKILPWCIPLPYIAIMAGWTVAEVGRQPWIVYKIMPTAHAASPVPGSSVAVSLAAFAAIYLVLGVIDIYLLRKYALKGPDPA